MSASESKTDLAGEFPGIALSYQSGDYPAAGKTVEIGLTQHVFVPDNCTLKDMESSLAQPVRIRARLKLTSLASFLTYCEQHLQQQSQIFATIRPNGLTATAIFDYPGPGATAWGDHRATFQTMNTPEWVLWMGKDNTAFSQSDFADFVADHSRHFVAPPPADMETLARAVEFTKQVNFTGAVPAGQGETAVSFTSEVKAGNRGTIDFPDTITLALKPFVGAMAVQITARLKPHVSDDGKLTIRYKLMQPHVVIEAAVLDLCEKIVVATKLPLMEGEVPERV